MYLTETDHLTCSGMYPPPQRFIRKTDGSMHNYAKSWVCEPFHTIYIFWMFFTVKLFLEGSYTGQKSYGQINQTEGRGSIESSG